MSFTQSVSLSKASHLAIYALDAGFPVLFRGPHGIGKSECVYQIARYYGLPVVERRFSQLSEGDATGLPFISNNEETKFYPMDWLLLSCREPVVLFLDEIDRATRELRQAAFQIMDSRAFNGNTLHPQTKVMAAVNSGEFGQNYEVYMMDRAEQSRYVIFDVAPTVEEFLDHCKKNDLLHKHLITFLQNNQHHIEKPGDLEITPGMIEPCRRSWVRCNKSLTQNSHGKNLLADPKENETDIFLLVNAHVGADAATSFKDFLSNVKRKTLKEVFNGDYLKDDASSWDTSEFSMILEEIPSLDPKREWQDKEVENLVDFFLKCPVEFATTVWEHLGSLVSKRTDIEDVKEVEHSLLVKVARTKCTWSTGSGYYAQYFISLAEKWSEKDIESINAKKEAA